MGFFRGLVRNRQLLTTSFASLVVDWVDEEDPWAFREVEVEPHFFGSRYDFWHYLDGESKVSVKSVRDICRWLAKCQKASDLELFREHDYWQHPATFEQLRRGDCEDHALWAWRKLHEIDTPARFVIGRHRWDPEEQFLHAWVTLEVDGQPHVLESTSLKARTMLIPFTEARAQYTPHLSVGHQRGTRVYGGFIQYRLWLMENRDKLKRGDPYRPLTGGQPA